jgi:sugar phosphate isomerase/epimerase
MPFHDGLPILGAALSATTLPLHRDWLFGLNRDLEIQDFDDAAFLNGDWRPHAAHMRQLLDGHKGRVGIHGPFWGFAIDSQDPDVRAVVQKRQSQGLDVCEALGATHMVVYSPYTTWDYYNFDDNPGSRGDIVDRVHETLRPAVARAETMGVTLVIENIEDIDPQSRVKLTQSFDSTAVRVSLDTGHAYYAHGTNGAPPVDYYVEAAGDMLAHVHLQDADGYADRHWLPGDGTLNWRSLFRAMARYQSDPRLIIEVKDQINLMCGVEYLVSLGVAV